jgi:hypothetical protein
MLAPAPRRPRPYRIDAVVLAVLDAISEKAYELVRTGQF